MRIKILFLFLLKRVLLSMALVLLSRFLFYFGLPWGASFFIPFVNWIHWVLSAMEGFPLPFGDGGSEAGPSSPPLHDLNFPPISSPEPEAHEPEPAPSSDLLEAENRRLREENLKLKRAYEELRRWLNEEGLALLQEKERQTEEAWKRDEECHRARRIEQKERYNLFDREEQRLRDLQSENKYLKQQINLNEYRKDKEKMGFRGL